jgi:iron complex transport system permease protein
VLGALALLGALIVGALTGASGMSPVSLLREVASHFPGGGASHLSELEAATFWQIRLPRVVLAALVGGALGLCGCAYQGAFRNPLVDPYLLGSAAGAGFGATLAIVYGGNIRSWPIDPLPAAAFVGSLIAVGCSYSLSQVSRGHRNHQNSTVLVLAGVAVASFFTAMQTFVQQKGTDTLRVVYSPYLLVAAVVILMHRRMLDVLSVGDDEAKTLGISPSQVRLAVVVAASLGTSAAVAVSGLIGFVGLVIPHAVRLVFGSRHRITLPASALFGAAFLVLADVASRTIVAPAELPIGVITAFFGAPFFGWLLVRKSDSK